MKTMNTSSGMSDFLVNVSSRDTYSILKKLDNEAALRFLPVIIFLVILIVMGTPGNIIVSIVYSRRKRKSTSDYFILNLAFLDLFTCLIGIPMEIADLCLSYTFDAPAACKILRATVSLTSMASVLILVVISMDRYKRICKFGESFSYRTVKRLCITAFIIGAGCSWPAMIIVGEQTIDTGISGVKGVDCSTSDEMQKTVYPLVYYCVLMFCFLVCVIFVVFVYVRISIFVMKMKRSRKRVFGPNEISSTSFSRHHGHISLGNASGENSNLTGNSADDRYRDAHAQQRIERKTSAVKVTRTTTIFVAVTIAFIVSYLPFLAAMVLRNIISGFERNLSADVSVFYKFCLKCFFINNAINPLIYSFLSGKFKQEVKDLLQCTFF